MREEVLRQQLQPVLDKFDPGISAGAYVEDLTHFQRFVVELVKAVVAGCRLIILRDVSTFISDLELSSGAVEALTFSVASGECVVLLDLQNRIFHDLVGLFTGEVPMEAGAILLGGTPYRPGRNRQIAVICQS